MKLRIPLLSSLVGYGSVSLRGDLTAGLTVGILLIPQGMAYAMLAGLPPIYGLYAAAFPLIVYAFLGSSRQLAVGPAAMVALLVASSVGPLAMEGSPDYVALVLLMSLLVGIIQLLLGTFGLGFLANFISHPVISGFTSAAAIIIAVSQLKHVLGLAIPRGGLLDTIYELYASLAEIHLPTLFLGTGSVILLLVLRSIHRQIPSALILVLVSLAAFHWLHLDEMGVATIGSITGGFPGLHFHNLQTHQIWSLLPMALAIALVGFLESFAVAKAIERKHRSYKVKPNQELIALGVANILGSFLRAFPVAGGFSRTAINDQAGAQTGVASIISALVVLVSLFFLAEYFEALPIAALAAIIITAVLRLVHFGELKRLWKLDKLDFLAFTITAVVTLLLGIEVGILAGVASSIIFIMYKISQPHIAQLGRIPGTSTFRNLSRFEDLEQFSDIVILRFDAQLFFANADYLREKILSSINQETRYVILEAGVINNLDSSAIETLDEIITELEQQRVQLILADVKGPVRDKLHRSGLMERIGPPHFYLDVASAIHCLRDGSQKQKMDYAHQFNKSN